MKVTKDEIVPISKALNQELSATFEKMAKRKIPFCIAYSIGTNEGEPYCGGWCSYMAPKGYEDLAMLSFELNQAMIKCMSPND